MRKVVALLAVIQDEHGNEGTRELGEGKFEYRLRNGKFELSTTFPDYQTLDPKERYKEFKTQHNTWGNPDYLNNREVRKEKPTSTTLTDFLEE